VEVWQTSNLRRLRLGEEKKKEEEERRRRTNHSMKIYMVSLFHRATINYRMKILWSALLHRATIIVTIDARSQKLCVKVKNCVLLIKYI